MFSNCCVLLIFFYIAVGHLSSFAQENKKNTNEQSTVDNNLVNDNVKKSPIVFRGGDNEFIFGVKIRMPEFFYSENVKFLNFQNDERVFYWRHILDLNGEYHWGKKTFGHDALLFKMDIRNKGIWGDPESIALTTETSITEASVTFGGHRHAIPRHIFWIRQLMIELNIADVFKFPFCNKHTFTFGAFPFELGRGIALGSAYATDATDLGFYAEAAVDQYAFGGKLTGQVYDNLAYDFYIAILRNLADSFDNVNQRIYGNAFGRQLTSARGFGIINYVLAGRTRWDLCGSHKSKARLEPYALFNSNPEQQIEFLGDASSNLWTLGVAGEFETKKIEIGFDMAFNLGHQDVKGWDRNLLQRQIEGATGNLIVTNTMVKQGPISTPPSQYQKMPQAPSTSYGQPIIASSRQCALENGQVIGTPTDPNGNQIVLVNGKFRFTEPYRNIYAGSMFVIDGSYYFKVPDLKFSLAFGYASGDANPNQDAFKSGESDSDSYYEGFIGLQEIYSGTRVRSAFMLSGSGKIPRILTISSDDVYNPYANTVSRFTDIIYSGISLNWKPKDDSKKLNFNPNIITYWQPEPATVLNQRFFNRTSRSLIARHLGTEFNIFFESEIVTDLKYFAVGCIFLPGEHFNNTKGIPLSKDQKAFIEALNSPTSKLPRQNILSNNIAYYLNMGLEYKY